MTTNGTNGNGTRSTCFVDVRCPDCRNIRTQACPGSTIRQQCRQCGIYFEGYIDEELKHFRLQYVEKKEKTPRRPVITSVNPPTLIG